MYIYGVGSEQTASLPRFRAGARAEASQNCLKIYRICVNIGSLNGIETAISAKSDVFDIYNLQGVKLYQNASLSDVYNLPRGIYIIGGKKIMIK